MNPIAVSLVALLSVFSGAASAATLSVALAAAPGNPAAPRMGDRLSFHTVIRNEGSQPEPGIIAWISLVETDPGKEQPVDLEDWSAHKVVTASLLQPGEAIETNWPMRLIQAGSYRVVVSAASRAGTSLSVSPFADFSVRQTAVVESQRILPVALGLPLLIGAAMLWRWRRR
jgi:hypothetical protein